MKNITDKEKMLEYSWRFEKSFSSSLEREEEGQDVSTQNDKSSPKFGSKLRIIQDGIPRASFLKIYTQNSLSFKYILFFNLKQFFSLNSVKLENLICTKLVIKRQFGFGNVLIYNDLDLTDNIIKSIPENY